MKKIYLVITIACCSLAAHAQKEILHLQPDCHIANSNYTKVIIMNHKKDTADYGIIKIGALNKTVKVKFEKSFTSDLTKFHLDAINGAAKKEGTLLIDVRKFSLGQKTGAFAEKGLIHYTANYFISTDDINFIKTYSIDTTYIHRSMEVTGQTMEGVSIHLCENIKSFLAASTDITSKESLTIEAIQNQK